MLRSLSKFTVSALHKRWGHTATVLDGKKIAGHWQSDLEAKVIDVTSLLGRAPGLGVVLVGSRPDSRLYVQRKQEACVKIGIKFWLQHLPESVSQAAVESAVSQICQDTSMDGILVQLPLPKHLDEEAVVRACDPRKDVDGFHPQHRQLLKNRQQPYFLPCTALGVMELIARSGITLPGKTAVVIGDSSVVGTPLAMLLQANGVAALTVCPRSSYPEAFESSHSNSEYSHARADTEACLPHQPKPAGHHQTKDASQQLAVEQAPHITASKLSAEQRQQLSQQIQTNLDVSDPPATYSAAMRDLPSIAQTADILIVAVGHAELVKRSWIKPGAVVIDVGINVVGNIDTGEYHVVGDIAYAEVAQVASALTPVPGGVGPMTIAAVLHNTIQAARSNC
ncbi:hypothetical protein WJX77_005134 [Trebouxia sp. C0004]